MKDHIRSVDDLQAYSMALLEIAQTNAQACVPVFEHGFHAVKDCIKTTDELRAFGLALLDLAAKSSGVSVIEVGLPSLEAVIKDVNDVKSYGEWLRQIAERQRQHKWIENLSFTSYVLRMCLTEEVRELIGKYGTESFVEIDQACKELTPTIMLTNFCMSSDKGGGMMF